MTRFLNCICFCIDECCKFEFALSVILSETKNLSPFFRHSELSQESEESKNQYEILRFCFTKTQNDKTVSLRVSEANEAIAKAKIANL